MWIVSAPHAPSAEGGARWDDPTLGIAWPAVADRDSLSSRDRALPRLGERSSPFGAVPEGA
jgi:dTDP-4-dehydrorhamnose 3,5-epimerase